jgi:O-succinylbenzoate synthase
MHIECVELRLLEMDLVAPFETSFGRTTRRQVTLLKVTGDGLTGWGECVAEEGPWYSYETRDTAWHILRDFAIPRVLGRTFDSPTGVWDALRPIRGHNMAKAGLELATWDLWARQQGVSLSQALGGTWAAVEVGVSVGIQESIDDLLRVIGGYLADGYRRIKIKIKPGWDVDVTRAVRQRFPTIKLQVDANSAYSLADADRLKALDEFDLLLIEQPLSHDDIIDHAQLQCQLRTPICLDESIHHPDDARHALDLGSCRIINIKAGRVGGLGQSKAIHDLCLARSAPVWCGGMLESGVGRAHNVALASLPGFTLPGDISASRRYWHQDIVEPEFVLQPDGTMAVPTGAGIGVIVRENLIEKLTVAREVFG